MVLFLWFDFADERNVETDNTNPLSLQLGLPEFREGAIDRAPRIPGLRRGIVFFGVGFISPKLRDDLIVFHYFLSWREGQENPSQITLESQPPPRRTIFFDC